MKVRALLAVLFLTIAVPAVYAQDRTPAPPGSKVYFITPKDGARIKGPVTVRFGLAGMGIAPAGVPFPNSGHHHLLIDTDPPSPDQPIPADDRHVHFGKGQTETVLTLAPGRHTLQLLLADHQHRPHEQPVISEKITITVR
jgi:hypothetical protein